MINDFYDQFCSNEFFSKFLALLGCPYFKIKNVLIQKFRKDLMDRLMNDDSKSKLSQIFNYIDDR